MNLNRIAISILLLSTAAWAQQAGLGGPGAVRTGAPTAAELSRPMTDPPAYVSGGVIMADGGTVPKDVVVELHCGGFPRGTSHVSPKGEFDISLNGNSEGVVDATRQNGRTNDIPGRNATGVANLSGCFVRAELPGYQSTQIALATHSIFDNPNVGDLVLTKLEGITGDMVSATSMTAPKKAVKSFDKAKKEISQPDANLEKSAGWLEEAVAEYPAYATAWDLLGRVRLGLGQNVEARQAFERAIAADPKYIGPYPSLVKLVASSGELDKAVELARKTLELNPHLPEVRFYLCASQLRAGDQAGTIATANQMIERGDDKEFPQAHQLLGAALANAGNYAAAADSFRKFLELSPDATAADRIRQQIQEWESLGAIPAAQ